MSNINLVLLILIIIIIIIYIYNSNKENFKVGQWWCSSAGRPSGYSKDCKILGSCSGKWKAYHDHMLAGAKKTSYIKRANNAKSMYDWAPRVHCYEKLIDEGMSEPDAYGESDRGDDAESIKRTRWELRMRKDLIAFPWKFNDFCDIPCSITSLDGDGKENLGYRKDGHDRTQFEKCRDKCRGCFAADGVSWIIEITLAVVTMGVSVGVISSAKAIKMATDIAKALRAIKKIIKIGKLAYSKADVSSKDCGWWTGGLTSTNVWDAGKKLKIGKEAVEKIQNDALNPRPPWEISEPMDYTFEDGAPYFVEILDKLKFAWKTLYYGIKSPDISTHLGDGGGRDVMRRTGVPDHFCLPLGAPDAYCSSGVAEKSNDGDEWKHDRYFNYLRNYDFKDIPGFNYNKNSKECKGKPDDEQKQRCANGLNQKDLMNVIIKMYFNSKDKEGKYTFKFPESPNKDANKLVPDTQDNILKWIELTIMDDWDSSSLGISRGNPWHGGTPKSYIAGSGDNLGRAAWSTGKYVGKIDPRIHTKYPRAFYLSFADYNRPHSSNTGEFEKDPTCLENYYAYAKVLKDGGYTPFPTGCKTYSSFSKTTVDNLDVIDEYGSGKGWYEDEGMNCANKALEKIGGKLDNCTNCNHKSIRADPYIVDTCEVSGSRATGGTQDCHPDSIPKGQIDRVSHAEALKPPYGGGCPPNSWSLKVGNGEQVYGVGKSAASSYGGVEMCKKNLSWNAKTNPCKEIGWLDECNKQTTVNWPTGKFRKSVWVENIGPCKIGTGVWEPSESEEENRTADCGPMNGFKCKQIGDQSSSYKYKICKTDKNKQYINEIKKCAASTDASGMYRKVWNKPQPKDTAENVANLGYHNNHLGGKGFGLDPEKKVIKNVYMTLTNASVTWQQSYYGSSGQGVVGDIRVNYPDEYKAYAKDKNYTWSINEGKALQYIIADGKLDLQLIDIYPPPVHLLQLENQPITVDESLPNNKNSNRSSTGISRNLIQEGDENYVEGEDTFRYNLNTTAFKMYNDVDENDKLRKEGEAVMSAWEKKAYDFSIEIDTLDKQRKSAHKVIKSYHTGLQSEGDGILAIGLAPSLKIWQDWMAAYEDAFNTLHGPMKSRPPNPLWEWNTCLAAVAQRETEKSDSGVIDQETQQQCFMEFVKFNAIPNLRIAEEGVEYKIKEKLIELTNATQLSLGQMSTSDGVLYDENPTWWDYIDEEINRNVLKNADKIVYYYKTVVKDVTNEMMQAYNNEELPSKKALLKLAFKPQPKGEVFAENTKVSVQEVDVAFGNEGKIGWLPKIYIDTGEYINTTKRNNGNGTAPLGMEQKTYSIFNSFKHDIELYCGSPPTGKETDENFLGLDGTTGYGVRKDPNDSTKTYGGVFCNKSNDSVRTKLDTILNVINVGLNSFPSKLTDKWHGKINYPESFETWSQDKKDLWYGKDFNEKVIATMLETFVNAIGEKTNPMAVWGYGSKQPYNKNDDAATRRERGSNNGFKLNTQIMDKYICGHDGSYENAFVRYGTDEDLLSSNTTCADGGCWTPMVRLKDLNISEDGKPPVYKCDKSKFPGYNLDPDQIKKGSWPDTFEEGANPLISRIGCQCLTKTDGPHTLGGPLEDETLNMNRKGINLGRVADKIWPSFDDHHKYDYTQLKNMKDGDEREAGYPGVFKTVCGADPLNQTQNRVCISQAHGSTATKLDGLSYPGGSNPKKNWGTVESMAHVIPNVWPE
jgi:hypothetical protein